VSCAPQLRGGRETCTEAASPEAGEGDGAPANFDGVDVPSVAHFGQGVEGGGNEGHCTE
jgi:hypothetical protein